MSKVILDISMSLDGFVAQPGDDPGPIHDWLFNGDTVEADNDFFETAGASTRVLNENLNTTGAIVTGRRTYDVTGGWGGSHPMCDAPMFVVTHSPPDTVPHGRTSFTFVDGVQAAVEQAQRAAGNKRHGPLARPRGDVPERTHRVPVPRSSLDVAPLLSLWTYR